MVCGRSNFVFVLKKNTYHIVKCKHCGLVSLDYSIHTDFIRKMYGKPYYTNTNGDWITQGYPDYFSMEKAFEKSYQMRLKKILQFAQNGHLLDVGCGPGFFLRVASNQFDVTGIEVSEFAANYIKTHLGLSVINKSFYDCKLPDEAFDVVTLWDAIEHFKDPISALEKINRILKADGVLALQTGDVSSIFARLMGKRWHLYNVPEHLFFFSKRIIKHMLKRTGFSIRSIHYEWSYFSIVHLLDRLIKMVFPSKVCTKQPPILSKIILPVNLFDVITVYAVKN